jgi:hypothetical protein
MDADAFRHFYDHHLADDRMIGDDDRPALLNVATPILLSHRLPDHLISLF